MERSFYLCSERNYDVQIICKVTQFFMNLLLILGLDDSQLLFQKR